MNCWHCGGIDLKCKCLFCEGKTCGFCTGRREAAYFWDNPMHAMIDPRDLLNYEMKRPEAPAHPFRRLKTI